MTDVEVELVALIRAILEDFGGRLTVMRPEVGDSVQKAIGLACAGVQARCDAKREQIARTPPQELEAAAEFLRNMRINFLEVANEGVHFC